MVAKKKNPIDELFDQFMDGLFQMAEYFTGGALNDKGKSLTPDPSPVGRGEAALSKEERGGSAALNEKLKCEEEMTDVFLVVPIKSEQAGTEAPKRKRKRQRVKMVEGELFGE